MLVCEDRGREAEGKAIGGWRSASMSRKKAKGLHPHQLSNLCGAIHIRPRPFAKRLISPFRGRQRGACGSATIAAGPNRKLLQSPPVARSKRPLDVCTPLATLSQPANEACRVRKPVRGRLRVQRRWPRAVESRLSFAVVEARLVGLAVPSEDVEIRTPFRAPKANAFAERWVGTVRRELLDRLLIVSRRQLEDVLRIYVDHCNTHRPHRALELTPPIPGPRLRLVSSHPPDRIHRRDRLGGIIHEYARAA